MGYRGIRVGEDDDIQRGYSVSKCGMISTRSALICSYVCTSRGRSFILLVTLAVADGSLLLYEKSH